MIRKMILKGDIDMRIKCIALICVVLLLLTGCGGGDSYGSYDFDDSSYDFYEDSDTADSETTDFYEDYFMVYALVPEGWGDIFLWAGADGVSGMFPDFPGMPMAPEGDGWYSIPVNNMFERIIISANGGAAITEDIICDGQDIWVEIGEASYTVYGSVQQSGVISAGGFTEPDGYDEASSYDQLLDDIKQPDIRIVSDGLDVMAMLGYQDGIPVKIEYGWDSAGLKEMSIQTYYDMNGVSDQEISEFITELRNLYQVEFGGYGCVQVWDELRDAYVVLVVYCTGLEEPAYSRTAAYLFGGGDILVDGDMIRMPTSDEAAAMGYYVRYY